MKIGDSACIESFVYCWCKCELVLKTNTRAGFSRHSFRNFACKFQHSHLTGFRLRTASAGARD